MPLTQMCVLCTSLSSVRCCYCYNAGALDNMVLFAYVCAFTSDHHHLTFTSIDFQHWHTHLSLVHALFDWIEILYSNWMCEKLCQKTFPIDPFLESKLNVDWDVLQYGWSVGRCLPLICSIIAILSKCNWIRRARKTMVLFFTIMMLSKIGAFLRHFFRNNCPFAQS